MNYHSLVGNFRRTKLAEERSLAGKKCAASLGEIVLKATIVHTATYFVFGLLAFNLFDYATRFATPEMSVLMRPTTDNIVIAGTLFQPIRGALFGVVFYTLRDVIFVSKRGWLITWAMLALIGILAPFGPAPGSIEGALFLRLPLSFQFNWALVEVYGQSLALALGTYYWVRNPRSKWLRWGFPVLAGLAILLTVAGLLLSPLAQ